MVRAAVMTPASTGTGRGQNHFLIYMSSSCANIPERARIEKNTSLLSKCFTQKCLSANENSVVMFLSSLALRTLVGKAVPARFQDAWALAGVFLPVTESASVFWKRVAEITDSPQLNGHLGALESRHISWLVSYFEGIISGPLQEHTTHVAGWKDHAVDL